MTEPTQYNIDNEGLVLRFLKDPRPDLKDLIIVQYSTLVERVARRFAGIEPLEDLTQVGYIGLLNALSRFDPENGVKFNTYASYLIAGEIKHYLRDRTMTIRHPAWLQELRQKVTKTASLLQQDFGRIATEREISEVLQVSEASVREVFQTQEMIRVGSLDQPLMEDENSSEVDTLDSAQTCPEQLSVEDRMVLDQAMKKLRDLERQVLMLFHFESLSQTEIASKLGISCNYVSHILRQSVAKLRKILLAGESKAATKLNDISGEDAELIDSETGAYSESFFHSRLQEEIHRSLSAGTSVSIFLVRFNGLNNLTQYYGEQSVMDFLSDASDFIRSNVRRLEIVTRYGESGFAIIFPETGPKLGIVRQRLLSKMLTWMSGKFLSGSGISLDIGMAIAPEDGKSYQELMAAAKMFPAESFLAPQLQSAA